MAKITSVKSLDDTYSILFTENEDGRTLVQFAIKEFRKDKSFWYQKTPSWYFSTLFDDVENKIDHLEDVYPDSPGLYIDYGADWFIPAKVYASALLAMMEYNNGKRFNDIDIDILEKE